MILCPGYDSQLFSFVVKFPLNGYTHNNTAGMLLCILNKSNCKCCVHPLCFNIINGLKSSNSKNKII